VYAYIREIERGFFEGVCRYVARLYTSRDPPPLLYSRIDSERRALAFPVVRF
jgi:hypothetical protein